MKSANQVTSIAVHDIGRSCCLLNLQWRCNPTLTQVDPDALRHAPLFGEYVAHFLGARCESSAYSFAL